LGAKNEGDESSKLALTLLTHNLPTFRSAIFFICQNKSQWLLNVVRIGWSPDGKRGNLINTNERAADFWEIFGNFWKFLEIFGNGNFRKLRKTENGKCGTPNGMVYEIILKI